MSTFLLYRLNFDRFLLKNQILNKNDNLIGFYHSVFMVYRSIFSVFKFSQDLNFQIFNKPTKLGFHRYFDPWCTHLREWSPLFLTKSQAMLKMSFLEYFHTIFFGHYHF
jgi:hypothetical protein